MRILLAAAPLLIAAAPAADRPDPNRLHDTVEALVRFGTRHTASTTTDPKRGIGAARAWARGRFEAIARGCGGCLRVESIARTSPARARPTASRWSTCSASSRVATLPAS